MDKGDDFVVFKTPVPHGAPSCSADHVPEFPNEMTMAVSDTQSPSQRGRRVDSGPCRIDLGTNWTASELVGTPPGKVADMLRYTQLSEDLMCRPLAQVRQKGAGVGRAVRCPRPPRRPPPLASASLSASACPPWARRAACACISSVLN
jgi:hypothetical protein